MSIDYLPTATLDRLHDRSQLIARLREIFVARGYWECETPILSGDIVLDANLDPFTTRDGNGSTLYLQTSPEAGMKRLVAAGATAIFQISRVFRCGEFGRRHNPEFTMVEWYRVGDTHWDQMDFVEHLVREIYASGRELISQSSGGVLPPFERLTYDAAFERHAGSRVLGLSNLELRQLATRHCVPVPESLPPDDRDGLLNVLLAGVVEPHLGRDAPQFLIDYPASQAALARVRNEAYPVAERFELYDRGVELCNGYHELTDPAELSRRTQAEQSRRRAAGTFELPGVPRLAAAMEAGLPPCCGVALGLDRLIMLALGCSALAEVIAFPHDRA